MSRAGGTSSSTSGPMCAPCAPGSSECDLLATTQGLALSCWTAERRLGAINHQTGNGFHTLLRPDLLAELVQGTNIAAWPGCRKRRQRGAGGQGGKQAAVIVAPRPHASSAAAAAATAAPAVVAAPAAPAAAVAAPAAVRAATETPPAPAAGPGKALLGFKFDKNQILQHLQFA